MFSAIARVVRRALLPRTVSYVKLWEDELMGLRFMEAEYDARLQTDVAFHYPLAFEFFEVVGGKKICVVGGRSSKMGMSIPADGPRIGVTHKLSEPTENMLKAREYFKIRQERKYVCRVCGQPAKHEIEAIHFEMRDDFSTSSMGGVDYACGEPGHLEKIRSEVKGIRVTTGPLRELVAW